MDVLLFLARLPGRIARFLARLLADIGEALKQAFGSVAWSRPPWMGALAANIRAQPRTYGGSVLGAVVALALGIGGYEWYIHRPHAPEPARITMDVETPAISDYEKPDGTPTLVIHPLDVKFSASAAPIERVGKKVTRGIAMDPALKGVWEWVDDKTLRFTPDSDWAVGLHEEVRFDVKQVFAPHVLMADDHVDFDMPGFQVSVGNGEFYQDPQNPTAKKTIIPVFFNYPVDPAEFEKRITLWLKGRDDKAEPRPLKFTITYDPVKLKAWVHSQPLDLPRDDDMVEMKIDAGVRSTRGGDPIPSERVASGVRVPGLYSLNVGDVSPTLVNNDRYEPEQVLVLSTTDAVRGADLEKVTQAWVLPKRKAGVKQKDDEPPYDWGVGEVSDDVLKHSQPLKLVLVPTEKEFAELQSFKYHAEPGQHVFIRFAAGLKSFGGYILGHPVSQALEVPDYPKLLKFMADGSLLSLSGDKRVSVVSRNVPGMKLEIGRVLPDQLQHLVSLNDGTYTKPELNGTFDEDHIVERFEEKREFPKGDPGTAQYEGIDLSQYLKAGKHGVFWLRLTAYDPKEDKKADASDDDASSGDADSEETDETEESSGGTSSVAPDARLIVVTDLGMLAKRALDGSRDVFVQSISTGQPVAGASVSVLALNGETLFSETTGGDGAVHFPTLKGLLHEKKPVLYVVKKGDDLSFLPVDGSDRRLDYSRFDIGGEANATSEGQLSAYLFSDRGIYRPGDLFHIGLIVRTASWAKSPAGIPLQAEIVDPRGVTVKRQPLTVDASGFSEISYTPAETAPTGTWTVNLYLIGKDANETSIGSTTVSVKEFLPDSMKVDATLSDHVADGWVKPGGLKGVVDARNLFGTPAANRRVEATLTLNPTFPAFRAWPDYQFFDLRHAKDGYTTKLQDGKTDDKGHAEFDLDLKKYADATYKLDFLAKAYEAEGGRSVAATASTLVSSNPWLVGYKAVDDLSYVQRGSKRAVRLVAIDPRTNSIALGGLQAQFIERRYVSVLTKQDSGVYKYESRLKEVPISATPLTIPAGGMDYTLPTDKPGDYALLIRQGDVSVNRIEYTVTGAANLSRSLERNAELQITLNKKDYVPGEAVEVSLRAPYAGAGLITIERDKVYAHAWFSAKTTNSVQHITVPAGFEGNGYINVQYIRDPSSDEVFMSPLSYGVVPFSVNVDARRNALTLEAPDLVKPGTTVTYKLHAAHPSRVVVFAVDEGILQVAHYKLGDPLQFFFRKRMLDVQTAQILDLILPDFKKLMAMAAPGGDGSDAVSRQLNPFKRKRDKPVAYWSGIVDVNGERDFQYAVPDYFHGKLRVMAVAVSPDLIGTAQGGSTVRGDFVLSPDAPTTLAPGDEAEVGVGVSNNLPGNAPIPVAVTLKTGPQLQVMGPATQTLTLASMHEGVATFRVKALGNLGSGALFFSAGAGGKTATQRTDISVRPAATFRTQLDFGRVASGSVKSVAPLRNLYDAYAVRTGAVSTVPLVLSNGLASWLVNTDNYCSEQITSSAMPRLIAAKWANVPAFTKSLHPILGGKDNALMDEIDVLHSRQNEAGGFGLWSATPDAEPFVSAYVMHFLLEARDRGVVVPDDMITDGNKFLQQIANDDAADSLYALRQRAYAVYLLTRQGNVTTNQLAAVQRRLQQAFPNSWRNDLAAAWLAASYKLMRQDKQADALIAPLHHRLERNTPGEAYFYDDYDDPLIEDATTLYLLAKHFPDRARSLSPRAMDNIARPLQANEFNTLSAAMTMLALDTYAGTNATSVDKLRIDALDFKGQTHTISQAQNNLLQAGSWNAGAVRINILNGSPVMAWSVLQQSGYDRDVSHAAIKNGLEIIRDYTDAKGNALTKITVGEEIFVHVKIRATGDKGVGNIAIVDLLPGGFEPVMSRPPEPAESDDGTTAATPEAPTVTAAGSTWRPSYSDVREDRVVIYGTATPNVGEFVYRIKADAAGKFIVPPAYGESMYDRRIQARAPGGDVLTVVRP